MGRPRLHNEATERGLLAAAEGLLAVDGVAGLTVRRLAEAAGTSARAIYSVFGDRPGLVRALFHEAFVALREDIKALPLTDDPMADLVAAGTQGFRRWAHARPALFRMVFEATPRAGALPPTEQAGVEAFGLMTQRVHRCVLAGLLPPGSEPRVALAFHALCEGMASLELRGRFPLRPDDDAAEAWRINLTALVKGFA
jgi:AcrR family transcriptional regulator